VLPDTYGFLEISCVLNNIPKFDRQGRAGSLTVWQFDCGATITLQTGEKRQAGRRKGAETVKDAQF